jgi:hypothetical protein
MAGSPARRDVQRNAAFFLGAFGTALGVLGGVLSALGIMAWLLPDFAQTAPDWFFMLVVVGLMVLFVGAWPALDWLVNRRPVVGGPVLAVLGLLLIGIGVVAVLWTAWGLTGWLAMAGGVTLLPAGYLALVGGGTEPLTWRSLRTERVQAVEARLDPIVGAIFGVVGVVSLSLLILAAIDGRDWITLGILAVVGTVGCGWLLFRRRRR